MHGRLEFQKIDQTEEASRIYLEQIDAQIEEVADNLDRLRATRRAVAELIGENRNGAPGSIMAVVDAADRAHFEGEGEPDRNTAKTARRGL